jgi:GTP cyclohydrolase I
VNDAGLSPGFAAIPAPQTTTPSITLRIVHYTGGVNLTDAEHAAAQFLDALGIDTSTG